MIRPPTHHPRLYRHRVHGDNIDTMRRTLRLIGQSIKHGSSYLPLRNYAAALATTAPPKDYLGQARKIYEDITKRWRYVKDPWRKELLSFGPKAMWNLVLAGDGVGVGAGRGAGDCDCISAANGAMLQAIGLKVRIATTSPISAPPGPTFSHVFVQVFIPKLGWVTSDPVVYPQHGFGYTTPHSRIAYYDLDGRVVGMSGNVVGFHGTNAEVQMSQYGNRLGELPDLTKWHDYGFSGVEDAGVREPDDWRTVGLPMFGAFAEYEGILSGEGMNLHIEATPELGPDGQVYARTPLLELAPDDYFYMKVMKRPYDGMLGLGDDGQLYEYDGLAGWFKKLFKKVKRGVKKVAKGVKRVGRRIAGGIKRVISKIPGGKYLIKLGGKIFKIAKKLVKPLMKYVGPLATKLAPIAALIPGYGPAISAGLLAVGKVSQIMAKTGAAIKMVKGVARLKFPSGSAARKMQQLLSVAAQAERKRQKRGGKIPTQNLKRIIAAQKKASGRARHVRPARGGARALHAIRAKRYSRYGTARRYRRV